jgi:hypothetical protein
MILIYFSLVIAFLLLVGEAMEYTLPLGVSASITLFLILIYIYIVSKDAGLGLINLTTFFLVLYSSVQLFFFIRLLNNSILIAYHSPEFQTEYLFRRVSQLSLLGLASFGTGWGLIYKKVGKDNIFSTDKIIFPFQPVIFWVTLVLSIPFIIIVAPQQSILSVSYSEVQSVGYLGINVIRPAGFILLLFALLICIDFPARIRWILWGSMSAFALGYVGFLAGNRVESLGFLIGISVGWQWKRKNIFARHRVLIVSIALVLLLQLLGYVRSANSLELQDAFKLVNNDVVSFTQADVAVTLLVTVGLVDRKIIKMDYGRTFWNILLQTFPTFITPNRPPSYAELIQSFTSTGGGSYIINELYVVGLALSVAGGLFIVGTFFAYLEFSRQGVGGFILYLMVVASLPRFVFYGWIALYKYILTGSLLYMAVYLLSSFFYKLNSNQGYPLNNRLIK